MTWVSSVTSHCQNWSRLRPSTRIKQDFTEATSFKQIIIKVIEGFSLSFRYGSPQHHRYPLTLKWPERCFRKCFVCLLPQECHTPHHQQTHADTHTGCVRPLDRSLVRPSVCLSLYVPRFIFIFYFSSSFFSFVRSFELCERARLHQCHVRFSFSIRWHCLHRMPWPSPFLLLLQLALIVFWWSDEKRQHARAPNEPKWKRKREKKQWNASALVVRTSAKDPSSLFLLHGFNAICVAPNNGFCFYAVNSWQAVHGNGMSEWCNGVNHRRQTTVIKLTQELERIFCCSS